MPVGFIEFRAAPHREDLAVALIQDLPEMITVALDRGAGVIHTRQQVAIDIRQVHPAAYNVASLAVVVQVERGKDERVFEARDRVRFILKEQVHQWLVEHPRLRDAATLSDVEVDLRFVEMCGINIAAVTGAPNAHWGGPGES